MKDIFISYKNDGEGNNFAARLYSDLNNLGYDVYYNPNEQHAGSFPDRLREAVESCKDFLLVVTQACLEQLIRHDKIDWVREELLTAYRSGKNIIPLLMPGVTMPKDKEVMPKDLRFLPDKDAVCVFEPYDKSPLGILLGWVKSKPIKDDVYRDTFNSNVDYDVKKDLETIIEKANNGDVMAMYEAACFYYDALACDFDYDKASYWLFKVSDCDNKELSSHANAMLASMYYNGTIAREGQSYEKALYHRMKATENEEAQMQAAAMRRIGSGCEFNYDEIISSFESIKNGDSISKMEQALFYIDYGEFDKAIDILESMSGVYPEAEYRLGLLYKLGVHTKPPMPDCYKAEHHFRKAVKKGHIMAAYEYGMMNFNPVGGYPKDFEEAEKYFLIAADGGIAEAQYKLGWIYRFGLSGKKDIEKAIKYCTMGATQGHIGAIAQLSVLYQAPGYINYAKAFKYAKQSADMGEASSAYRAANFYFIGRGCEPDVNKAYEYYKFAYEHGVYRAKIMMDKIEDN